MNRKYSRLPAVFDNVQECHSFKVKNVEYYREAAGCIAPDSTALRLFAFAGWTEVKKHEYENAALLMTYRTCTCTRDMLAVNVIGETQPARVFWIQIQPGHRQQQPHQVLRNQKAANSICDSFPNSKLQTPRLVFTTCMTSPGTLACGRKQVLRREWRIVSFT
eukprot:scaffold169782_cov43-Prasinocladus_malaysianus.AAC.1